MAALGFSFGTLVSNFLHLLPAIFSLRYKIQILGFDRSVLDSYFCSVIWVETFLQFDSDKLISKYVFPLCSLSLIYSLESPFPRTLGNILFSFPCEISWSVLHLPLHSLESAVCAGILLLAVIAFPTIFSCLLHPFTLFKILCHQRESCFHVG